MPSQTVSSAVRTDDSTAHDILIPSRASRDRCEQPPEPPNTRASQRGRNPPAMAPYRASNQQKREKEDVTDDLDVHRDSPLVRHMLIGLRVSLPLHVLRPDLSSLCDDLSCLSRRTQKHPRLHHWLQELCFAVTRISRDILSLLTACSDAARLLLGHHRFALDLLRDDLPRLAELHLDTALHPFHDLAFHARRIAMSFHLAALHNPTAQAPKSGISPAADQTDDLFTFSHKKYNHHLYSAQKSPDEPSASPSALPERRTITSQPLADSNYNLLSTKNKDPDNEASSLHFPLHSTTRKNHPPHTPQQHTPKTQKIDLHHDATDTDVLVDIENCTALLRKLAATLRAVEAFWAHISGDKQHLETFRLVTKVAQMSKATRSVYIQSSEFRQQWTHGTTWWVAVYALCNEAVRGVIDLRSENYRLLVGEEVDSEIEHDLNYTQHSNYRLFPDAPSAEGERDSLPIDVDCQDRRLVSTLSEVSEDDEITIRLGRLNGHLYSGSKQNSTQKLSDVQQALNTETDTKGKNMMTQQRTCSQPHPENIQQIYFDTSSQSLHHDCTAGIDEHGDTWQHERSQGTCT